MRGACAFYRRGEKPGKGCRDPVIEAILCGSVSSRYAVVGSPNFDPRSLRKNTESVLLLDSPELADWLLTEVRQTIRHTAYELRLDEDSSVVWAYLKDRVEAVRKSEPGGGFSDILVSTFFTIIPMDSNL